MKILYDKLAKLGLKKPKDVDKRIGNLSESEIESFLHEYHEFISKHGKVKRAQIGEVCIFPDSWANPIPLKLIKQLCIYVNRIYIHDPLLDHLLEWKGLNLDPNYVFKYPDKDSKVREFSKGLLETLKGLLILKPLILDEIITLVPSQLVGFQKEPGAIYTDTLYGPKGSFREILKQEDPIEQIPEQLIAYAESNLKVYPAKMIDGIPTLLFREELKDQNMIALMFENDPRPKVYMFFSIIPPKGNKRKIQMSFDLNGKAGDIQTFKNWVKGSRNEFIFERISNLQKDLYLSELSNSTFLTNVQASSDLASINLDDKSKVSINEVMTTLMNIDLPYFKKVQVEDILKARKNEAAFEEFRIALYKALSECKGLGVVELKAKGDEIIRDFLIAPISKIDSRLRALKRNLFLDALMLTGSLVATFLTGGNTLTAAAALLVTKQTISDYKSQKVQEDQIKELPSFFYWDITKKYRK
jgi:hypothetical protein